jgi:hypothetical protein
MTFGMQPQYDGMFIKLEEDFQQCNGIGTLCRKYASREADGKVKQHTEVARTQAL